MDFRPWFLSLTAIWIDDSDAFEQLNTVLQKSENAIAYPQHHSPIPLNSRHSTIFAILQINNLPNPNSTLRDFSRNLITLLTAETDIVNNLSQQ
jgi:hypothetical protein